MKLVSKRTDVKKLIDHKLIDLGMTVAELCKSTGIDRGTYYRRIKEPGTMRLDEFRLIAAALKFTEEEVVGCIKGILG